MTREISEMKATGEMIRVESAPLNSGSIFTDTKLFNEIGTIAKVLAESSIIPSHFQKNVPNVLIALEISIRMKTSPMLVMQNLYVVNGKPAWSSQYIIAVINASGKYKSELQFEISGKGETLSCYAWATTRDGEKLCGPAIDMKMAEAEGWTSKDGSKWKTMPEVMIRYRAASFFGRIYCSDLIMGIYAEEEVATIPTYDRTETAAHEARAEIAANANSVAIVPPKSEIPPTTVETEAVKESGQTKKQPDF
jgi:hypothetical protein